MITDPQQVKTHVASQYFKALNQNVPEDRLQLLRNFQSELVAADAPTPPPMPTNPALAKGAVPPVSELMPFNAKPGMPQ